MDTQERYRQIIQNLLTEIASFRFSHGDIQSQAVFDTERDHYLVMTAGWDQRRVHHCSIHLDIIDGKIWVQRDNTDLDIVQELENAGVPKEHIVLAFHPPWIRQETGYAVA